VSDVISGGHFQTFPKIPKIVHQSRDKIPKSNSTALPKNVDIVKKLIVIAFRQQKKF